MRNLPIRSCPQCYHNIDKPTGKCFPPSADWCKLFKFWIEYKKDVDFPEGCRLKEINE